MRSAQSVCLSDRGIYAFGGDLGTTVALSCADRRRLTVAGLPCQSGNKTGLQTASLAFRKLFLQRENPADEGVDIGVRDLRIRRHGNLAPNADAAILDFCSQFRGGILVALVLRRNLLIRGT